MATVKLNPATGKVSGTNSNMPLVIVPSEITNLGSLTQAEADSCRIYSDSSLTTELAREVVSADEIHVKVSSVSSSTEVWFDYDGVRSDYATTDTYGAEAVWAGFLISSRDGGRTDSTGNGHTITENGDPTLATGKIGDGLDYDGTGDYTNIATSGFPLDGTVSFWLKGTGAAYDVMSQLGTDSGDRFIIQSGGTDGSAIRIYNNINGRGQTISGGTADLNDNVWHLVHVSLDGSTVLIHFDGSEDQSVASGNDFTQIATATMSIAATPIGGNDIPAIFDEVRLAESALSGDWRTTEYNNQVDNGAFWEATAVSTFNPAIARRRILMGM